MSSDFTGDLIYLILSCLRAGFLQVTFHNKAPRFILIAEKTGTGLLQWSKSNKQAHAPGLDYMQRLATAKLTAEIEAAVKALSVGAFDEEARSILTLVDSDFDDAFGCA